MDQKKVDDSLSNLTKYIPTEVLTLYLPALAVASALDEQNVTANHKLIYWLFAAVVTPVLSLLVYLRKRAVAEMPIWPSWSHFPMWSLIAATVAFFAWALAIPGNPYIDKPAMGVVSGFVAVAASTVLSLIEPLFVRKAT